MESWQKRKIISWLIITVLVSAGFLTFTCVTMHKDKTAEDKYWNQAMNEESVDQEYIDSVSDKAVHVSTGTYVTGIKSIDIKSSNYRMVARVWFKWKGHDDLDMVNNFRIYNGTINEKEVLEDTVVDGEHYQLAVIDFTVSKNYWTKRFPLESHQLRFYLEAAHTVDEVILDADEENSGVDNGVGFTGYKLVRNGIASAFNTYESSYGDPQVKGDIVTSEIMTQIEINRSTWGLYLKCFIALFGAILWVVITLFLCTYHRVDPLGMLSGALFGSVSNIMVGANLLPEAMNAGLLEYVNIWGIMFILGGTMVIISTNRIRKHHEDMEFAKLFGRIFTLSMTGIVILGNILMPLIAYMR